MRTLTRLATLLPFWVIERMPRVTHDPLGGCSLLQDLWQEAVTIYISSTLCLWLGYAWGWHGHKSRKP